jgi:catechol 2,3-dioxygenase-like lactoylglutathione lyase family enzyme
MSEKPGEIVPPDEQLVAEIYVRDLTRSLEFMRAWGFELVRAESEFAELRWNSSLIFLEQVADLPPPPAAPTANIRVIVPDVDRYWAIAQSLGARVIRPIDDRYYGLRDFTVAGPDGVALRFASPLASQH